MFLRKKGMAGLVTIVLVMALLSTVAISYIKLMETENNVTAFGEQNQKAADAAFCGISYAMAKLQTQRKLFKSSTGIMDRPYIVLNATSKTTLAGQTLNNKIESKWNYMDDTKMVIDGIETETASPPYRFRVFTYPLKETGSPENGDLDLGSGATLRWQYYMVKSQGEYFEYDNAEKPNVIATHSAQYLAQLKLDKIQKRVFLYRYKPVPYQAEKEFYKYLSKIN